MKLCSIINAWLDTIDLLPSVIDNHLQFSDAVIIVWSNKSNRGQEDTDRVMLQFIASASREGVTFIQLEPLHGHNHIPHVNEVRKRNVGIAKAREMRFTHYFIADADEFYMVHDVDEIKYQFAKDKNFALNGVVFESKVYIKKPTFWVPDHTLVPFIHRMKTTTNVGNYRGYPHAYVDNKVYIDPTRRPNETEGIVLCRGKFMHHMSYIRKNMQLKIQNSSANLVRSEKAILKDQEFAAVGYRSNLYGKIIEPSPNYFNL